MDVHVRADGAPGYLLDCQADLLSHLNIRLVVPLLPLDAAPKPADRLNPVFDIAGTVHVMVTPFAAAVLAGEMGQKVVSLANHEVAIINALDIQISGV